MVLQPLLRQRRESLERTATNRAAAAAAAAASISAAVAAAHPEPFIEPRTEGQISSHSSSSSSSRLFIVAVVFAYVLPTFLLFRSQLVVHFEHPRFVGL
jgi:hypothetical protein